VQLAFTGDVMLGAEVDRCMGRQRWRVAQRRSDGWQDGDVIGNLECFCVSAAAPTKNAPGELVLYAPAARLDQLAAAGFSGVTLANNHVLDCGSIGLRETIEALDRPLSASRRRRDEPGRGAPPRVPPQDTWSRWRGGVLLRPFLPGAEVAWKRARDLQPRASIVSQFAAARGTAQFCANRVQTLSATGSALRSREVRATSGANIFALWRPSVRRLASFPTGRVSPVATLSGPAEIGRS
jgi:Bacterial capsule synthesis protein PGA_cap